MQPIASSRPQADHNLRKRLRAASQQPGAEDSPHPAPRPTGETPSLQPSRRLTQRFLSPSTDPSSSLRSSSWRDASRPVAPWRVIFSVSPFCSARRLSPAARRRPSRPGGSPVRPAARAHLHVARALLPRAPRETRASSAAWCEVCPNRYWTITSPRRARTRVAPTFRVHPMPPRPKSVERRSAMH